MDQSGHDNQEAPQNQQPSMKQRVELARGKNVPIDYFLFTCLEHERTQRAQFGEDLPTSGRWPFMVGATAENPPADFGTQNLKTLLNRMCGWYAAQHPDLVEEIPLDYEVLNQIVAPFMNFTLDLADLVFLKTATSLPSHNANTDESQAVWNEVSDVMKEFFPGYFGYFIRFLKWAFADLEPEEFEPGSRPPVGKNMPNFRAIANAQHQPVQRNNNNQGGGGHHRNSNGGGGNHQRQHQRQHGGGNHNQQGGGRDNRHQNRNHQQNFSNKPQQRSNSPADAEIEKTALAAVDDAMRRISAGEVEEVFLKPMNSFYRRIQHQYAVDKGFESCSVGEGNERGVKVSKPLDK
jgi:hypothetical protein